MLQHIALTVNDLKEIENFFENILLFTIKHKFLMIDAVSKQIFNIKGETDVYIMGQQDIQLEIFISPKKEKKVFSHICFAFWKAEIIYNNAIKSGYKVLVKNNRNNNTYFIWDKSGNMFEIKERQD